MSTFNSTAGVNHGVNDVAVYNDFRFIKGFSIIGFQNPGEYQFESKDEEVGLLILDGVCDITIDGTSHENLGKREDVFSGIPTGIYVPADSKFSIKY